MAWDTGSLSHALCASPVDPLFMKTLLEHNIKSDGVQFSMHNIKSDGVQFSWTARSSQWTMHAAQNKRLRLRVIVQVLFSDHVKISKAIASSIVKETGESHDKATKAVPTSEQLSMHEIYIARAAKIYGLPETLEIYEHAISSKGLPEKDAMKICIKYAEFRKSHGETDHMFYKFNIMSTSLPDINHPNLALEYQLQSTLLSFDVPACPRSSRLKGLTVNFRYTISDDDWDALGENHLTLEQEIVAFVLQAFFSRPKRVAKQRVAKQRVAKQRVAKQRVAKQRVAKQRVAKQRISTVQGSRGSIIRYKSGNEKQLDFIRCERDDNQEIGSHITVLWQRFRKSYLQESSSTDKAIGTCTKPMYENDVFAM
ncbi:hypothetical protein Tco_0475392 [Tanacetum coccineum]